MKLSTAKSCRSKSLSHLIPVDQTKEVGDKVWPAVSEVNCIAQHTQQLKGHCVIINGGKITIRKLIMRQTHWKMMCQQRRMKVLILLLQN